MTPEEEAYEEALRHIRHAEETGALELDLSGWEGEELGLVILTRLPPELADLTSLQSLNLSRWYQLSDLSPLAHLTSLQSLSLVGCEKLSDLSTLASLTKLQSLNLALCEKLSDLSPLASLTSLQSLNLSNCYQLSGDLRPLANFTSLQSLDLSGCQQLDLSPLANLTSLQSLNLYGCYQLSGDLSPLAGLTSLQSLDLSGCYQLSDLSPLAGLTSLQSLNLSRCYQLSGDLSPLAGLTSLQSLDLSGCTGIRKFAPLEPLLARLKELFLYDCRFDDLPSEVCGQALGQNVIREVRAHFDDLKAGPELDAELKVFILGNGGVGKTQLARRLQGLNFDERIPTTHGIELNFIRTDVELENFKGPVRLNLWDFGGQDIYHGSHTLFLHGRAIFLLLWKKEEAADKADSKHRPITYWLDYLRAVAGPDNPLIVCQSQCDTPEIRAPVPVRLSDWAGSSWTVEASARTDFGLGRLEGTLEDAAWACLHKRPPPPIGKGRLRVRDRLLEMLQEDQKSEPAARQHRLLEREEFNRLCDEVGGISNPDALLDFLHHNGVLFYRPGLFGDRIVLDQNWALEAIYSIFHRQKCFNQLKKLHGRFSREDLELLIWSDYTRAEQEVFLSMMESCGICFKVRELSDGEWEYIAPELLPEWSDLEQLLGRLRDDRPGAEASARYAFLHEGILRGYLSKLGEHIGEAAIYWRYGCWFYDQKTRSQALIESLWDDAASEVGPGTILFLAWGENPESLIEPLLETLQRMPVGEPPEIRGIKSLRPHAVVSSSASVVSRLVPNPPVGQQSGDVVSPSQGAAETGEKAYIGLDRLEISARAQLPLKGPPKIFVSYAWGDASSEVVERLCEKLEKDRWNIVRDKSAMRSDLISGFMKRIGLADHIIVVLSDKYLRSTYCMTELNAIYQRSLGENEDFLRRIIPLVMDDARFGNWRDRAVYAQHWKTEFQAMAQNLSGITLDDFRCYKEMQNWYLDVGDILAHVSDKLAPRGFDEIVKNDFEKLHEMLPERRLVDDFLTFDFRGYLQRQTRKLETDPIHRPSHYVPQRMTFTIGRNEFETDDALQTVADWLTSSKNCFALILGDSGTGKTFLLHELARRMATKKTPIAPILVEMQMLEKARTLDELVAQHLADAGEERIDLKSFRNMLAKGQIALLFDGFDKPALGANLARAAHHFEMLLEAAGDNAKIVAAGRTQHFMSPQVKTALAERAGRLASLQVARLRPFNKAQILKFLTNRLTDEQKATARLELLSEVKDLLGLSENPRMLTFIASLDEENLREAKRREGANTAADLYRGLLNLWLAQEFEHAHPTGVKVLLSHEARWHAVTNVAMHLWREKKHVINVSELTEEVARAVKTLAESPVEPDVAAHLIGSSTLLVHKEDGFSFVHQSIMEWLVANKAAEEIKMGASVETLTVREFSPLMGDFLCGIVGKIAAKEWASSVLRSTGESSSVVKTNALLILERSRGVRELVGIGRHQLAAGHLEAATGSFEQALDDASSVDEALAGLFSVARQMATSRVWDLLIRRDPEWLATRLCENIQLLNIQIGDLLTIHLLTPTVPVSFVAAQNNGFGWELQLTSIETGETSNKVTTLPIKARSIGNNDVQLTADIADLPWGIYLLTMRFLARGKEAWRSDHTISNQPPENPFLAGPPIRTPDRFFGRDLALENVLQQLQHSSLALLGPRRSGKTSFLYRIAEDCRGTWKVVFCDLHEFAGLSTPDFILALRKEIWHECQLSDSNHESPSDLTELRWRLRNGGVKNLLLLIDEMAVLGDHPVVAFHLRAMSKWRDPETRFVVAGTVRDLENVTISAQNKHGSSPMNEFVNFELEEISKPDAQNLLERPVLGHYRYQHEALEMLITLGAGRPFFLNMLANLALKAAQSESGRIIRLSHVESARRDSLYELDRWYRDFARELDDTTRSILPSLAKEHAENLPAQYAQALRNAGLTVGPRHCLRLDPLFIDWLNLKL